MNQQSANIMNRCYLPLHQAIELADIDHEVWEPEPDTDPKSHDFLGIQAPLDDAACDTLEMIRCSPDYDLDPIPVGSQPAEQHLRRLSPVNVYSVTPAVYLSHLFKAGEYVFLTPEESAYGQAYPVCEIGYDPLIQRADDWFFCANPVDGSWSCHAGRRPRFSLRYRNNLTDLRHLPVRFRGPEDIVLRMLMRLPLPIISIIRCRGSIHALIHIPGCGLMDRKRAYCELVSLLRSFGGIKASTAPNALTPLPSAIQDQGSHELLFLDPSPVPRPILEGG